MAAARYDLAPCGTATSPAWRPTRPTSAALSSRSRSAPNVPVAASSGGRPARSGNRWPAPVRGADPVVPGRAAARRAFAGGFPVGASRLRASSISPSTAPISKSIASSSLTPGWRAANSLATCSAIRRSRPRRPRRGGVVDSGIGRFVLALQDTTPSSLRAADPGLVRRPVDLTGGGEPIRVRFAQLERVEAVGRLARALTRPSLDGVGSGVEQLVEALDLVRLELREDVVTAVSDRIADPDAQAAELLRAQLDDDRAQAVVPAVAARLAETQLAERQREVVRDDEEVSQGSVLALQDLANRQA